MSDVQITRELAVPPQQAPQLDPQIFNPNEIEWAFLRQAISPDDEAIKQRCLDIQKDVDYPYPCIRAFHFVSLFMLQNPIYHHVIDDGKKNADTTLFLDLGCCMGTDVRKLALDGYPSSRIVGADIRESYITYGHKLFDNTTSSLPIHFIVGDIFNLALDAPQAPPVTDTKVVHGLDALVGRVRHLYTGALFHLFDEQTQMAIALRLIVLLQKQEKGAIIFGRHQGFENEGYIDDWMGRLRYAHSPTSWAAIWNKAFAVITNDEGFAGRNVVIKSELVARSTNGLPFKDFKTLVWSVEVVRWD